MDDETRDNLKKPASAPAVPKELLSARPAMTKVKPKAPDAADEVSKTVEPPQPTEEEAAERQERIDYLKNLRHTEKKKRGGGKKWLIALIIIVLLAAAGTGAYLLFKKPKVAENTAKSSTATQQSDTPEDSAETADMKTYDSSNFALSFKYPSDWTVADTLSGLTAISPKATLTTADGSQKSVAVVLHIRPQQATIPEFKAGSATAVLDSKNVTYKAPATGQRGSTYLSYLQYASTTTKGALDSIYVTGNAGYQKGQDVPMTDVSKVNPLINVSFVDCTTTCTPTSTSVTLSASSWMSNSLELTVETMIKSLVLN